MREFLSEKVQKTWNRLPLGRSRERGVLNGGVVTIELRENEREAHTPNLETSKNALGGGGWNTESWQKQGMGIYL